MYKHATPSENLELLLLLRRLFNVSTLTIAGLILYSTIINSNNLFNITQSTYIEQTSCVQNGIICQVVVRHQSYACFSFLLFAR